MCFILLYGINFNFNKKSWENESWVRQKYMGCYERKYWDKMQGGQ